MPQAWDPILHAPLRAVTDFGTLTPGTFFCKPDGGGSGDGWKIYKLSGAWTATNLPQFATQSNLDWHGLGETISFTGPPSRHFEIHHADETGKLIPGITRKGKAWTWAHRAPDVTLGCGVLESGGKKYLTIAHRGKNTSGTIKFSQRELSETYTNNGVYNATTNPLGWVDLLTVSLPVDANRAATPVFFNHNGRESKCLIGVSEGTGKPVTTAKMLTVTIGLATASHSISSVLGDENRDEVIIDTKSHSLDVAIGQVIDDIVYPECTAYDGEGNCIRSQYDYTLSGSGSKGGSLSVALNTPPVHLVDYSGTTAITAYMHDWVNDSSTRTYSQTQHYTFDQVNSDPPIYGHTNSETYNGSYTYSGGRKLVAPGLNIDIVTYTGSRSASWSRTTTGVTPDNVSDNSSSTRVERFFVYLDIRHRHAIYVEIETITSLVATGEFYEPDVVPIDKTETINTRFCVVLDGETTTVAENLGSPVVTQNEPIYPVTLEFFNGTGDYDNSSSSSQTLSIGDGFRSLSTHPQSVYNRLGVCGVASDAAGNVLLSVTVWDNATAVDTHTFLTDGNALTLIGATGADRYLDEVGLIDWDDSYGL